MVAEEGILNFLSDQRLEQKLGSGLEKLLRVLDLKKN